MADSTAQRWMRLMGGQGRPTARPRAPPKSPTTLPDIPNAPRRPRVDQSRRQGQAASARQARGWISEQLDEAAELLDQPTRDRIADLADAQVARRFPRIHPTMAQTANQSATDAAPGDPTHLPRIPQTKHSVRRFIDAAPGARGTYPRVLA